MTLHDEIKSLLQAPAMNVDDVRTLLRLDHEEAMQVARDMVDAEDGEARRALLRQLRPTLETLIEAEQREVYAPLRQLRGADALRDIASVRLAEQQTLETALEWLAKSRKTGSDEWCAHARALLGLLERHVEAEHHELFEALDQHFDDSALTAMGRRFLAAKARYAGRSGNPVASKSERGSNSRAACGSD
ncbi:MAG: hypothetical protein ABI777_14495 [Betaproteobacteria bacterium]